MEVKVLWDIEIKTENVTQRPDIVTINETKHTPTIIGVAVSIDRKIKDI